MRILVAGIALVVSFCVGAAEASQQAQGKIVDCSKTESQDCIVRESKDTHEASILRGSIVYGNYCVLCHGAAGKGDGRAARLHNPKPFDLTKSQVPPEYLRLIITKGGEAVGRYKGMPPWGEQLTDEQLQDLINYLPTLRTP